MVPKDSIDRIRAHWAGVLPVQCDHPTLIRSANIVKRMMNAVKPKKNGPTLWCTERVPTSDTIDITPSNDARPKPAARMVVDGTACPPSRFSSSV